MAHSDSSEGDVHGLVQFLFPQGCVTSLLAQMGQDLSVFGLDYFYQ